jgi:hypothetical protein
MMKGVTRSIGVLLACVIAGLLVAVIGGQLLPEHPEPNKAVLDAAAGKPFDTRLAGEWLAAHRRPGALLVWAVFPIAALAMGATAGALAMRNWLVIAAVSVLTSWAWLNWDSALDRETVQLGVLYVAVSSAAAWAVWSVRSRRRRGVDLGGVG